MSARGWGPWGSEEEISATKTEQDDDHQEQRNGRLVKSNPSKPTRITLRGAKPTTANRPAWNSGTSLSPTASKATAAKRSTRIFPKRKLPIRGKLPTQEEFSGLKDVQQSPVVGALPPTPYPTSERQKPMVPAIDTETGLIWQYEPLKAYLERQGGLTSAADSIESKKRPISEDTATSGADMVKGLRRAFATSQLLQSEIEEDSFFDSELMTSPRLKLPLSSPPPITNPSNPSRAMRSPMTSTLRLSETPLLEKLLAREQHRACAHVLSVLGHDEAQEGPMILSQAQQRSPVQLDGESCADKLPTPDGKPQSMATMEKAYSPIPEGLFAVHVDPDTSEKEEIMSQVADPPVPNMINKPCIDARLDSKVGVWDQFAEKEGLFRLKTDYDENIYTTPINKNDPQYKQKAALADNIAREIGLEEPEAWPTPQCTPNLGISDDERVAPQLSQLCLQSIYEKQTCAHREVLSSPEAKLDGKFATAGQAYNQRMAQLVERVSSRSVTTMNRSRHPRQSMSQSSIKSVKWNPAIITCGPSRTTPDTMSAPKVDSIPKVSKEAPTKSKIEYALEFLKTLSLLKKGDRKSFRKLLETLRDLDSDEDLATTRQPQKERSKMPNRPQIIIPGQDGTIKWPSSAAPVKESKSPPQFIVSCQDGTSSLGKGLNPRAPAFRERSFQSSTDEPEARFLNVIKRRAQKGEKPAAGEDTKASRAISRAVHSYDALHIPAPLRQEPIWISYCQLSPTIIDQEDDDFQEFCRAHNFIPLVPVGRTPIIPVTLRGAMNTLNTHHISSQPDSVSMTYTIPSDGITPTLPTFLTFQKTQTQPLEGVSGGLSSKAGNPPHQPIATQDFISLLEETSEPVEVEDSCREAKALDPVWGAQILENFVKKYPMTGQQKAEDPISEQVENQKILAEVQPKQYEKSEDKAPGPKPHNRAAQIQQKLEVLLLQQREENAPLAPAHKMKATEIQQKLEIILYMLKEQKALENFQKQVSVRSHGRAERSLERSSEKSQD